MKIDKDTLIKCYMTLMPEDFIEVFSDANSQKHSLEELFDGRNGEFKYSSIFRSFIELKESVFGCGLDEYIRHNWVQRECESLITLVGFLKEINATETMNYLLTTIASWNNCKKREDFDTEIPFDLPFPSGFDGYKRDQNFLRKRLVDAINREVRPKLSEYLFLHYDEIVTEMPETVLDRTYSIIIFDIKDGELCQIHGDETKSVQNNYKTAAILDGEKIRVELIYSDNDSSIICDSNMVRASWRSEQK